METSEKIDLLSAALVKAQSQMDKASKDSDNPFFKSKYASLKEVINAVKEPLNSNGISLLQPITEIEGFTSVETRLQHTSGQFMTSVAKIACAKPNEPQASASGVTYLRRYMIQSLLMLPTDDDDGEAASAKTKLDVYEYVKKLIYSKRKTPAQIKKMIEYAGGDPEKEDLQNMSREQLIKIKDALQR